MLRRTVTTLRKPAKTYRSPTERNEAVNWGRWLCCEVCGFNGDRDYCASLNIARLGVGYLLPMQTVGKARPCSITDPRVKPVSYTGAGSVLRLPLRGCDSFAPKTCKRSKSSNRINILLTTDSSMRGAIPLPSSERRNSILPTVATGPQSVKREKTGQRYKLDGTNAPSKLLWIAQANLCITRRNGKQAKAS